jgi:hypothetical protein
MKRRFYVTGEPRDVKNRQDIAPTLNFGDYRKFSTAYFSTTVTIVPTFTKG